MKFLKQTLTTWRGILLFTITGVLSFPVTASEENSLGSKSAVVTIIEYGSLTCDYCIKFHRKVLPLIYSRYIESGQVRFIYRDFPTSSEAKRGAIAARCSGEQYYIMLELLYAKVGHWSKADNIDSVLTQYASTLSIKENQFQACLNDPRQNRTILDLQRRAKNELGVLGTPTFIVNGMIFRGQKTIEEFEVLIKKALLDQKK